MTGRNITNHSLEKKRGPASIYLAAKQLSFLCFRFENEKNVKPKKISRLNKLKLESFLFKKLRNSINSRYLALNLPKNSA